MMLSFFSDFLSFQREAYVAALASQEVIRMRVTQFALGKGTFSEAASMVTEKADAFVDAQFATGLSFASGRPASAALDALRCYTHRVEANQARLTSEAR